MLFRLIGLLDRAAEGGRPVTLRFAVHPEDEVLREFVQDLKADFTWLNIETHEIA